jgi:hypothetical protein
LRTSVVPRRYYQTSDFRDLNSQKWHKMSLKCKKWLHVHNECLKISTEIHIHHNIKHLHYLSAFCTFVYTRISESLSARNLWIQTHLP